jgi:hypothetical protein
MDDLVMDFRDADGNAADSTLWLRNGGGKSSILNLFFAIIRPHRHEFLGGQSEARQRSLDDYILAGDRAITAAEWSLDAASGTLGFGGERLITGVFYERREAGGELRRLFFATRVAAAHPQSTLEGLPVYLPGSDGGRRRATLSSFREAWLGLRDQAPHLGVFATDNQREWQETLEAARIDPELFSYQVRMNAREGGVDELFRFATAEAFVDFLLEMALEPSLAGNVGRNIATWRSELVNRQEVVQPERELVARMLDPLAGLREVSEARADLTGELRRARAEIGRQERRVASRRLELAAQVDAAEAEERAHVETATAARAVAAERRLRAAALRRHAARVRLREHQAELHEIEEQRRAQRRLARIWAAAAPLRSALRFGDQAAQHRRLLENRLREHAPLRAELGAAAGMLAGALGSVAADLRRQEAASRRESAAARVQAREYRRQAGEGRADARLAEAQATQLRQRLGETAVRTTRLAERGLLGPGEAGDAALARWREALRAREDELARTKVEIVAVAEAAEALRRGIQAAGEQRAALQAQVEASDKRWQQASRDREAVEADATLRAVLELQSIDADRLATEAADTLDRAAQEEQRAVVQARLEAIEDQQALDHLAGWGLLPPAKDVQRAVGLLRGRLGGQAWSGWEWLEANVPAQERAELARQAPYLAEGVVVRAGDLERAATLLQEAGVVPDGPLAVVAARGGGGGAGSGQDAGRASGGWQVASGVAGEPVAAGGAGSGQDAVPWPRLPAIVLGPGEAALFDQDAGRVRAEQLRIKVAEAAGVVGAAEGRHRELLRARQGLCGFRERYPVGWFARAADELAAARREQAEVARRTTELQAARQARMDERGRLEGRRETLEADVRAAAAATQALEGFVADFVHPAAGWRRELALAQERARLATAEAKQWEGLGDDSDAQADALAAEAHDRAVAAGRYEDELRQVAYVEGAAASASGFAPGLLDELRTAYDTLRAAYEQRVGADQLAALARQAEDNAKDERARLARLLSDEITEELVSCHLRELANPDDIDSLREQAEAAAGSLLGSVGRLNQMLQAEQVAVRQAEAICVELGASDDLDRAPGSAQLADGEANQLEEAAQAAAAASAEADRMATEARERARVLRLRAEGLERLADGLAGVVADYSDLFAAVPELSQPAAGEDGPSAALDELAVGQQLRHVTAQLRQTRERKNGLDDKRSRLAAEVRRVADNSPVARQRVAWVDRILAHLDPALEEASARLVEQLTLRRQTLDDMLAESDRHRSLLADELLQVAKAGLHLLRQASLLSRLPDRVAGFGGAQFLRISADEPADVNEQRSRMAQLVDDLARSDRELGGIRLAQAAVHRLARPIQVRVMHPDPTMQRQVVSIPEMARFSGGEQLTGAILLYCTLAAVRGRARGQARRPSSVLLLDNPVGRVSRPQFLRLQREVARAMGVQLIYTTGVNDHEAISTMPNVIRLRNERLDRNTGRRLVEHIAAGDADTASGVLRAVRIGRREAVDEASASAAATGPDDRAAPPAAAGLGAACGGRARRRRGGNGRRQGQPRQGRPT